MTQTLPPEGTRLALITAGLHLFGSKGFAATSTRELAARAQTNVASIAYHFGGKDGLRLACTEEFARRFGAEVDAANAMPSTPLAAREALATVLTRMVQFVVGSEEAGELVPFMLREIAENGPGIDHIYNGVMEPTHRRFCALWSVATGHDAESEATKLAVFSMVGQVLYFRIGGAVIRRRMGWQAMQKPQIDAIVAQLLFNLDAVLAAATEV